MKNPDRDEDHKRRRNAGETGTGPDGKAVAAALYGGDTSALNASTEQDEDETEPTLFDDTDEPMSNNPNLDRSKRHEREIANAADAVDGLTGERAYASNGRALGESKECDVRLTAPDGTTWTVQAKRRKTVASYLTSDGADIVVTREDRGENLAVVPLKMLFRLLSKRS